MFDMSVDHQKYESAINYLYGLQKHGIKLGLSNTKKLMTILGNPQKAFRCIHIAGTNGKGSTASMIASILKESGYKTGLFTSPHLVSFTERISINNRRITEPEVIELANNLRGSISETGLNPTFFEFITTMAFYYFAVNHVDWAVVETGMGGRLDATNILLPDITAITNISLDHCEFLGNTISDITYEKAGIIKRSIPLVTAARNPEVINQLSDIAYGLNSEVHVFEKDFSGSIKQMDNRHITIDYSGCNKYNNLIIPLSGRYQLDNACTAIRTCEILSNKDISLPEHTIRKGLQGVILEGRLEWVSHSPPILLDGAHNPEASRLLASSVKELFPDKKIILIAGVMSDKDIKKIMGPLMEIAASIILTKAQYERSASSEEVRSIISSLKHSEINHRPGSIVSTATVKEAIELAKSQFTQNSVILITGSFYTTGEAKEALGHNAVLSKLRE